MKDAKTLGTFERQILLLTYKLVLFDWMVNYYINKGMSPVIYFCVKIGTQCTGMLIENAILTQLDWRENSGICILNHHHR